MTDLKRTPLFEVHQALGARIVEFGGWQMPVQYTGIADEHKAVRTAAGLFDISHMGEVIVTGPSAERFLNAVLTNDLAKLAPGQGHYTILCNEQGGVIDDLYAYRRGTEDFLLILNASRIDADLAWLKNRFEAAGLTDGTRMEDISHETAALALQGPNSAAVMAAVFPDPLTNSLEATQVVDLKKNQLGAYAWSGTRIWLARTGYTGEDGFELVAPAGTIEALWKQLSEAGQTHGLKPAGLGARDTLRTEMCYPLYGHELDEKTTPIEAGLGWVVGLHKAEFIGRQTLATQKQEGVSKRCIAFRMTGKSAPPRPEYPICGPDGSVIGTVTSGTQSPSLGLGIGMGYVPPEFAKPGTAIQIEIRGKHFPAETTSKPLYKKAV